MRKLLLLMIIILNLGCEGEDDNPEKVISLFKIENKSGHQVSIVSYNSDTKNEKAKINLAPNISFEKTIILNEGYRGNKTEIFLDGDSITLVYDTLKMKMFSCRIYSIEECNEKRNILNIINYKPENLAIRKSKFTYTITEEDYLLAK